MQKFSFKCKLQYTNFNILLFLDFSGDPEVTQIEHDLEIVARRTRKEMVFLHTEDTKYPSGTAR